MSLTLYMHPLSSFCQKVLVALYESATPFTPRHVDLGNPEERAALEAIWPVGRFPVLRDDVRDVTVPESTMIIEYLSRHFPGPVALVPGDPDSAHRTRASDRFFDIYIHEPMQKIVGDRLRPAGHADAYGVDSARRMLERSYAMVDADMATRTWATGDEFSMADCAAAPALFYAQRVQPFTPGQRHLAAYFARLAARPSFARATREAQPYLSMFPG